MNNSLITPIFLDWKEPLLISFAKWLRSLNSESKDLSGYVVICPSRRGTLRAEEILLNLDSEENLKIIPPLFFSSISQYISTISKPTNKVPASITETILILEKALDEIGERNNSSLLNKKSSQYLLEIRNELIRHKLTPKDLIEVDSDLINDSQRTLLEDLDYTFKLYEERLHELSLEDNPLKADYLLSDKKIILLGFHDLSPMERELIQKTRAECFLLIGAPKELSNKFKEDGTIDIHQWEQNYVDVNLNILQSSYAEIDCIKTMLKSADLESCSIAILDDKIIGPLQTVLSLESIEVLPLGSKPFTTSLWGSWLLSFVKANIPSLENISTFCYHPITEAIFKLDADISISSILDRRKISQALEIDNLKNLKSFIKLDEDNADKLKRYLTPCLKENDSIINYCTLLEDIIKEASDKYNPLGSIQEISKLIQELAGLKQSPVSGLKLELNNFYNLLKDRLYNIDSTYIPEQAVPVLGWQETYLDDSEYLLIPSAVEGALPQYPAPNPILTDALKEKLGIKTRSYFIARDNFLLNHLSHSRTKLYISSSREDLSGNQNKISKLLTLGKKDENLLSTLKEFYSNKIKKSKSQLSSSSLNMDRVIKPKDTPYTTFPLESNRLTASQIRDYIYCPLQFYFNHILKLRINSYDEVELPSHISGTILHELFSKGSNLIHKQKKTISDTRQELLRELKRKLMPFTSIAEKEDIIKLQATFFESKIGIYLDYEQSVLDKRPKEVLTEVEASNFLSFRLPNNEIIEVVGRIDRIEIYQDEASIVDFKTSDKHLKISSCKTKETWLDPQLPIYGIYAKHALNLDNNLPITLSLVSINKYSDIGISNHNFTEEDETSVKSLCHAVALAILNSKFSEPNVIQSDLLTRLYADLGEQLWN